MLQRLLINLFLLLAIIITGVLLLFPDNPAVEEDVVLTGISPDSVTTISIQRANSNNITFKKQGKIWMMLSPYSLPANPARINTMLGLLQAHSYTRFKQDEMELHRFRLEQPAVSVIFNDTQIDFGDTSPLEKLRYVRVADTVHMINDSLYQQLQTPATFFLSNQLLPPESKISAIIFPDQALRWQDERWHLTPSLDVSADAMAGVVNAWQQAQAVSVREYEEAENQGMITVELQDHAPLEFVMVASPPRLVLARPDIGLQYHFGTYESGQLLLPGTEEETLMDTETDQTLPAH